MNPNGGERGPQVEYLPEHQDDTENKGLNNEKPSLANPENSAQKQSVLVTSQIASDLAAPSSVPVSDVSDDNAAHGTMDKGSDNERIEKEWIEKAKTIVAKTKDDPFEQKEAMSKVKADYIKKRFNKTIKTDSNAK